jgi:RNAse (barnase) inhibitor barstar
VIRASWALRPGVRTVRGRRSGAELVADAEKHGASAHRVEAVASKAELLDALARSLRFPRWVGRNWDALADALGDLSWLPAGPVVIVWDEPRRLRAADPAAYDTALDVLAEASASARTHPLTILLVG